MGGLLSPPSAAKVSEGKLKPPAFEAATLKKRASLQGSSDTSAELTSTPLSHERPFEEVYNR